MSFHVVIAVQQQLLGPSGSLHERVLRQKFFSVGVVVLALLLSRPFIVVLVLLGFLLLELLGLCCSFGLTRELNTEAISRTPVFGPPPPPLHHERTCFLAALAASRFAFFSAALAA